MLSWIFTSNTYDTEQQAITSGTFSAAGTDYVDLYIPLCRPPETNTTKSTDGNEGTETCTSPNNSPLLLSPPKVTPSRAADAKVTACESLHPQPRAQNNSSSKDGLPTNRPVRHGRDRRHQGSQQETQHCLVDPKPLYGTFQPFEPANHNRRLPDNGQQRGNSPTCYPRASSNDRSRTASAARNSSNASQPSPKRGRVPGLPRPLRSVASAKQERTQPAAGGALGYHQRREKGREHGDSQADAEDKGFPCLDGVQDKGALAQGQGGALSVRERVAALEVRSGAGGDASPPLRSPEKLAVPIVYPLHYKRFVRRTSSGTATRPESPLYTCTSPTGEQNLHSPQPRPTPANLARLAKSPEHALEESKCSRRKSSTPQRKKLTGPPGWKFEHEARFGAGTELGRVSTASYLHGTKANCVRHGRKRSAERDMLAKNRSGAYIPTGLMRRRQMEATSPWATLMSSRLLGQDEGKEACPDCVAELRIKRREVGEGVRAETVRMRDSAVMKAVPGSDAGYVPTMASTVNHGMRRLAEEDHLVVTQELRDGLAAVVMQRQGQLRRLVMDPRYCKPTVETMQQLSQELAQVAKSIASINMNDNTSTSSRATRQGPPGDTMVLMQTPKQHDRTDSSRLSSVPELLEMIDHAADEIHFTTGRLVEHYNTSRRNFSPEPAHQLVVLHDRVNNHEATTQGLVGRQSIEEHYRSVHERLNDAAKEKSAAAKDVPAVPISNLPLPRSDEAKLDKEHSPASPTSPAKTDEKPMPTTGVPDIIRTKLTLPQIKRSESEKIHDTPQTPTQAPPPEHPVIHQAAPLLPPSAPTSPAAAATKPNPDDQTAKHHHNPFHSWLNPFRHHSPKPPTAPASPGATSPKTNNDGVQSLFTTTPLSPLCPKSADASFFPTLPVPGPTDTLNTPKTPGYHHAPAAPANLDWMATEDPEIRAHQQVIRAALRMQRDKAMGEAARLEREGRRELRGLAKDVGIGGGKEDG